MEHTNYAFWAMSGIATLAIAGFWAMTYFCKRADKQAKEWREHALLHKSQRDLAESAHADAMAELETMRAQISAYRAQELQRRDWARKGAAATNAKRRASA
jgi:hypothetical protein